MERVGRRAGKHSAYWEKLGLRHEVDKKEVLVIMEDSDSPGKSWQAAQNELARLPGPMVERIG